MEAVRISHQQLYNAALQERIGAWKRGVNIAYLSQSRSLTIIRADDCEMRGISQRAQQMTLRRLERAYQSFFQRVKCGQNPGFPRFKSYLRFKGWSYVRDGFAYKPKTTKQGRWFNGRLFLRDAGGTIRARGKARWIGGQVKQVDIIKSAGRWYASLAVECQVAREGGKAAVGLDWGVSAFATLAYADGSTATIDNDRLFQKQQAEAAERQRKASKSLRGKRSNRAKKKHMQVARAHGKLANQRKDRAHKLSALLIKHHALIATEKLQIANISRSAKGTTEKPGKNIAQKAGLNREILDTAPGMFLQMLRYKAEEAGTKLEFVETRKIKPSQTCPQCGEQKKKALSERKHICECGCRMSRDAAAALVMLQSSEAYQGWKPTPDLPPKTSPRAASAA